MRALEGRVVMFGLFVTRALSLIDPLSAFALRHYGVQSTFRELNGEFSIEVQSDVFDSSNAPIQGT